MTSTYPARPARPFQGRACTLAWVIRQVGEPLRSYVMAKRPRACILENVLGLRTKRHKETFDAITGTLRALGYEVHIRVLNTLHPGIPQSRPRVYVVALHGVTRKFKWPRRLQTPPLKPFLQSQTSGNNRSVDLTWFETKAGGKGKLQKHWYVLDTGVSKTFRHAQPLWSSAKGLLHSQASSVHGNRCWGP